MVKIGEYCHRVTVQKDHSTENEIGGRVHDWRDAFTTWAKVKPIDSQEVYQADQVMSLITHTIKMRYRPDVSPYDRFIYKGRILAVHSMRNIHEMDSELEFRCREEIED